MSNTKEEFFVQIIEKPWRVAPQAGPETFVINGTIYTVEPDNPGKVSGRNNLWYRQNVGFAGREFIILTDDGRRIVTHNLWMGDKTDQPDNAKFEGQEAKPVKVTSAGRFGHG